MAKINEHEMALRLRKKGLSYSQIKETLGLSKSTLSRWLKDYPLSDERISELRGSNQQRIEKFRATMQRKRQDRLDSVYNSLRGKLLPLSKKELYLAGLILYWGEGGKTSYSTIAVANTNPQIIKFAKKWLVECFDVDPHRFYIHLHLYKDMDIDKEISHWSNELSLDKSQFRKPYVKSSRKSDLTYKGQFGHGTCNLYLGDVKIKEEILMGMKLLAEFPG